MEMSFINIINAKGVDNMLNKDNYIYRIHNNRLQIKMFDREADMINYLNENQEEYGDSENGITTTMWKRIDGFSITRIY